ncbi:hypothetical protein NQ315_001553 [Exocentrus adspersus]|uniref:Odorant receptor n=1 Tax=Exocentrus adspersus TaxID=1586481 RepID=A0AAV8W8Q1_9CUCU|nr:hypothetical protein NQ315_001553 [Exocentrus adspersus]
MIEDHDLLSTFTIDRKLLLICGVYPNQGEMPKSLHRLSSFLFISISFLINIAVIVFITENLQDVPLVAQALLFSITQTSFLCKLLNLHRKKVNLLEIEQILSGAVFATCCKDKTTIIQTHVKATKTVAVVYRAICVLVCVTYAVFPLMDEGEWTLPLQSWTPFEVDNSVKYWTVFAFHWISFSMSPYVNSSIDILAYMLITLVASQFEILKDNLTKLRCEAEGATVEFDRNVVLHYEILRLMDVIADTFSLGTFVQFFSSVMVICFIGFQLMIASFVPVGGALFISICLYFASMVTQLGMYCWFGHNIIASSDKINEAVYMSNWYEADSGTKKSILIFMEKCKRPVVLTAGKLFPLSLDTFIGLMRSSYSYFAVLQRLYGSE